MPEPSLRYVVVNVHGEMRISRTEYILRRNSRSESRECRGYFAGNPNQPGAMQFQYGPLRALIQNRDLHYSFHLDIESGLYTAWRVNEYGSPSWVKPKGRTLQPSGRTVHVHTETIDTGARREIFGYSARRVIIRTSHRFNPDNDRHPSDTEADGWYIDPPVAWLAIHPATLGHAILQAAVNGQFDTPVFTDVGPRETGFPVLITRTHRSSFTDAEGNVQIHTSEDREEVTDFSEEPLESGLFLPPRGFRRVSRLPSERPLPFVLRIRLGWENLKDAFVTK
jgi:hypothetical protein